MSKIDWELIADELSVRFGVELTGTEIGRERGMLRVNGVDAPNGFGIAIEVGWRSVDAIFKPDTFAAGLLRTIKETSAIEIQEFLNLVVVFAKKGIKSYAHSQVITGFETTEEINFIGFNLKCTGFTDHSDDPAVIIETGNACMALMLSLLPVESIEDPELAGMQEGRHSRIEVSRYERSPANRAAAISFHGAFCQVCGFDFKEAYGPFGHGYIEVHHIVPVSEMGQGYAVNPVTDLIPLCANCHSMIHHVNPPLLPSDLKAIMTEARANSQ
jgi:5-methylcytosine-specific restriction protein A